VKRVTSRIRSAIGAAMILACASPVGAQAQQPAARPRSEAQWLERRAAARQMLRWRMAHPRMAAVTWRRGYSRGWVAGRYPRAAAWQRSYARSIARSRVYGRYWDRRRFGRMGGRWSL
jgi:hypothetical protein